MPVTGTCSLATLLILPSRPLGADAPAVEAIAQATGLEAHDVRVRVARGRPGVLLRTADRGLLEGVAGRLRGMGHAAVVVTDDDVRDLPTPVAARGVTPKGALAFVDESGRTCATIPAGAPILVAVAHLHRPQPTLLPMNPGRAAVPDAGGVAAEAAAEMRWLSETDRDGLVIDVAWNGGRDRVRLRGERLVFATLGTAAAPSAAVNIRSILSRLLAPAHHPTLDLEFEQFHPPRVVGGAGRRGRGGRSGRGGRGGMGGGGGSGGQAEGGQAAAALDRSTGDRDAMWDSYVRFLIACWAGDLFDRVGVKATVAGCAARLTRVAAAAGSGGSQPDSPATPRVEQALLLPDHAQLTSSARRWVHRLGHVGPSRLVGTLLAGTAAALAGTVLTQRAHPWPAWSGLGLGLLSVTHALTLFDRRRRIENVPTSRIRSAAVGAIEVHGHARAASPLRTPFSQMPCVWYEFRMVRRDRTDSGVSVEMPGFTFRAGGDRPHDRVQIVTGHSNDTPFYIEDDTGRLEIDPRGAQVEVSTVQTLNQVPFAGAPLPAGTRVEITERYIPVDQPIWVMGHLRVESVAEVDNAAALADHLSAVKSDAARMAAGDENRDGVVDAFEWQSMLDELKAEWEVDRLSATSRTDRLVLGRSARDGFFYITERSEKLVVRRFALRALFWLAAGAGLLIWAALSLASGPATGV